MTSIGSLLIGKDGATRRNITRHFEGSLPISKEPISIDVSRGRAFTALRSELIFSEGRTTLIGSMSPKKTPSVLRKILSAPLTYAALALSFFGGVVHSFPGKAPAIERGHASAALWWLDVVKEAESTGYARTGKYQASLEKRAVHVEALRDFSVSPITTVGGNHPTWGVTFTRKPGASEQCPARYGCYKISVNVHGA